MIKCAIGGITYDGQKILLLLTYIADEIYEIYENNVTVEKPTLMQVNPTFKVHFAQTSNFGHEFYLFRESKQ